LCGLQGNGNARQELIGNGQARGRPGDRMARQMGEGLAGEASRSIVRSATLDTPAILQVALLPRTAANE